MRKKVAEAVIDSSALLCVALGEPAAKFFLDGFSRTGKLYIGAATRAETWLAVHNGHGLSVLSSERNTRALFSAWHFIFLALAGLSGSLPAWNGKRYSSRTFGRVRMP